MTSSERNFLVVLYALYIWECIYWLLPGEVSFTRSHKHWVMRKVTSLSFTLLGRAPLFRNPASFRAGLIVCKPKSRDATNLPPERRLQAQLRWVERRSKFLHLSSTISGFYLLVLLPAIVASGFFLPFWKLLAALLMILHGFVIADFFAATHLWRSTDRNSYFQTLVAISLNPLAAIRSADLLSKWAFERAYPQQLETVLGKRAGAQM
jgi:hypothetical protein